MDKGSPGLPKITVKDLIERKARKEEKDGEVLSSQKMNKKDPPVIEIKARKEEKDGEVLSSGKDGDVLSCEKDSAEASLRGKKKKNLLRLSFVDDVDESVANDAKNIKGKRMNDSSLPGTDLCCFRKCVPPPPTRPSLWDFKKNNPKKEHHSEEKEHNEPWFDRFDRFEKPSPPGRGVLQHFQEVQDDDGSKLKESVEICRKNLKSGTGTVVSTTGRYGAEKVWDYLTKNGLYAARWHAGMHKLQQDRAELDFKKGSFDVYVVTADLLRRKKPPPGFVLLNYDLPIYFEDYKKMLLEFREVHNLINRKSGGMCLISLVDSGIEVPEFVEKIYKETTIDRKK